MMSKEEWQCLSSDDKSEIMNRVLKKLVHIDEKKISPKDKHELNKTVKSIISWESEN